MPKGVYKRKNIGRYIACEMCGLEKWYKPSELLSKHFFCSKEHRFLFQRQNGSWNKGIYGYSQPNISKALVGRFKGRESHRWIEEGAAYNTIHEGLTREYGKPKKCEHCPSIKDIQWANISGKYSRDISDWLRLCIPCHRKFDKHGDKIASAWKRGSYANR